MAECSGQEAAAAATVGEDSNSSITSGNKLQKTDTSSAEDAEPEKTDSATKVTSPLTPLLIEDIDGESIPASYALVLEAATTNADVGIAATSTTGGGNLAETVSRYDVIVLFVYVIMLELGFIPMTCARDYAKNSDVAFNRKRVHALCARLPPSWKKSATFYDLTFVLGDFMLQQCRMMIRRCIEDSLLVNCKVCGVADAQYSMLVDPSQYVIDSRVSLQKRFQHVRQFATIFKNKIAIPAKWRILEANDVRTPKLQDLPPELKIELEKLVKVEFFNDL